MFTLKNKTPLFVLTALFIMFLAHWFYPRWQNKGSEATLSWDVFGYYLYLPAYFIYDDLEQLAFVEEINKTYAPAGENFTLTNLPNGNKTGQYSLGWAIFHTPAFLMAHVWAKWSDSYSADGFSLPYQFCISMYDIVLSILGLWLTFRSLLFYFHRKAAAWSIILLLLGTNALNYFAIDTSMTHAPLFFLYSVVIYLTILWHQNNKRIYVLLLGLCIGLMAIMRPTEIIAILIPLLWGIKNKDDFFRKIQLIKHHIPSILLGVVFFLIPVSIQIVYWKSITGNFIFYSYGDQSFSWLSPHFSEVLFSYRKGWFKYTPLAILFFIGLIPLFKHTKHIFWVVFIFLLLNLYIVSAWDIWWYGGSLGQRALVQSYALSVFPLTAFLQYCFKNKIIKYLSIVFIVLSILHNLAFHYKAHSSAPFEAEAMSKAFYLRTYFDFNRNEELFKLLDTDFIYEDSIIKADTVFGDTDSLYIQGYASFSDTSHIILPLNKSYKFARVYFTAKSPQINGYYWNMPQFNLIQKDKNTHLKSSFIRVHRWMKPNEETPLYMDIKIKDTCHELACYISVPHGDCEMEATINYVLLIN